jgi:hypothetical protein
MANKPRIPIAEPLSPEEAKELLDILDRAIDNYGGTGITDLGTIDELEQAIGMYVLARHVGWKPLVLVHNKRTLRKYEEIVGLPLRLLFDEEGPAAMRSVGYRFAKRLSNFWKAVSGEVSVPDRRKITNG